MSRAALSNHDTFSAVCAEGRLFMTLVLNARLGPYEILSALGAGGMGEVYCALDTRLEREVAIKVLPEQLATDAVALARFNRETRAIAGLSHPHIVAIFDVGTDQGKVYAVMELLQGQTLGKRIKQGPLEWREAAAWATAIAEGLAAAHAKGIIHRDIKPENVFLTKDAGLKILDFGLARVERPLGGDSGHGPAPSLDTQPGVLMGTVYYMSPEQVRGTPADARAICLRWEACCTKCSRAVAPSSAPPVRTRWPRFCRNPSPG